MRTFHKKCKSSVKGAANVEQIKSNCWKWENIEIINFNSLMPTKELLTIFLRIRVIWVKNENTEDNHFFDVVNPNPFILFGYPIIKGLISWINAYTRPRRIWQSNKRSCLWKKVKLDTSSVRKVDHRIKFSEKCRPYGFERKWSFLTSNARRYKHYEQRNMLLCYLFLVNLGRAADRI